MINSKSILNAKKIIPWKYNHMVEQDLIISKALISLYNNPIVRENLVFRGGTALNKLFLSPPARYSEDLDFVQRKPGKIGNLIEAIKDAMKWFLEESGQTRPRIHINKYGTKLFYRYPNTDGDFSTLKIEINTREHFQVAPFKEIDFSIDSKYVTGNCAVVTYSLEELMGTKLRALYQRRKGRDLFDAWYVFSRGMADIKKVAYIFHKYNAYNQTKITRKVFVQNMKDKQHNTDFRQDIRALLPPDSDWDFDTAFDFFMREVIPHI